MTDLERARDDLEAMICAVGVKHGLNIHPTIARDMVRYIQEHIEPSNMLLSKARREGAEVERVEWMSCARVDAMMEGPRLMGWNRSALDRLWKERLAENFIYKLEEEARSIAEIALRAALPAEPTREVLHAMVMGFTGISREDAGRAYRALRAHLLGEDA